MKVPNFNAYKGVALSVTSDAQEKHKRFITEYITDVRNIIS